MDLPLVSASPSMEATPPCRGRGPSGKIASQRSADSSSSADKGFSNTLLGACEPENADLLKQASPEGQRDLALAGEAADSPSQGDPIGADPAEGACLLGIRSFSGGGWRFHQTDAPGQAPQEGISGEKGAQGCLAVPDPHLEIDGSRLDTDAPVARRKGAAANAPLPDEVQEGLDEGTVLPEENGRGKEKVSEANPRIILSRMEALKGSGEPGELRLADARTAGQPTQGEAAALTGREGTSLRQEARIDPPSSPPPTHGSSPPQVPVHPSHAASAGTFRIFRNAVHLRIHDEELGPMRWKIHLNGTGIRAEAVVETSRIQALLHDHQNVLESKLNALGVEVEDLDVSVDQGSQNFCSFSEQHGSGTVHRLTREPYFSMGTETHVLRLTANPDQGLDLYA